jgi:hypothetical protein
MNLYVIRDFSQMLFWHDFKGLPADGFISVKDSYRDNYHSIKKYRG